MSHILLGLLNSYGSNDVHTKRLPQRRFTVVKSQSGAVERAPQKYRLVYGILCVTASESVLMLLRESSNGSGGSGTSTFSNLSVLKTIASEEGLAG